MNHTQFVRELRDGFALLLVAQPLNFLAAFFIWLTGLMPLPFDPWLYLTAAILHAGAAALMFLAVGSFVLARRAWKGA